MKRQSIVISDMIETKSVIGGLAIVAALVFILFRAGSVEIKTAYFCDVKTNNCFERLAMPLEKFK
jgi:hypothetical protein